jgi:hypothetical protein
MKISATIRRYVFFVPLTGILSAVVSSLAGPLTLEDLSPHFSTNMPILWQAPTNNLPKEFWIYKRMPRVFSAATISNAIILASFQDKGFPKSSTNQVILWDNRFEGEMQPPSFAILPDEGQLSFSLGDRASDSLTDVLTNETAVNRAWDCLLQLGIDRSEFVKTNAAVPGLGGVFLPRLIDGTQAYYDSQGFQFQQLGSNGKIREFGLLWPNLKRTEKSRVANPQQIIACIRQHQVTVLPEAVEGRHYFARLKHLSEAKKLTITKITPYYSDGVYGEMPTNNAEPPEIVTPIAELEAVADFGNSNMLVRIVSPIISSEVNRLLGETPDRLVPQRRAE